MTAHYMIPAVRSYRKDRAAQDGDMGILLGRRGDHWPKQGLAPRTLTATGRRFDNDTGALTATWEVPIKVWVDPKVNKPTFLRVKCECPGCHRTLPVGRLWQHTCRVGEK